MIDITPTIQIDDREIELVFIRAPGPGGQNVNKLSSAVQLRFNVRKTRALPDEIKQRLVRIAGKRMTPGGILIIEAKQYRSQEQNRQAARQRLIRLIQRATEQPKERHKTKPSHASIMQRLEAKRKRSELKRTRRSREVVE
jgi:ribosome-associated protein